MPRRLLAFAALAALLPGCVAYTVVDTTVGAAAKAAGTAVDVAAGTVDVVVPDGDDD